MYANGLKKKFDSINRVGSNFDWSILNRASLCGEAEVFSLPIADPNRAPMLSFDWFIHSGLILACTKLPQNSGERLGVISCFVSKVSNAF